MKIDNITKKFAVTSEAMGFHYIFDDNAKTFLTFFSKYRVNRWEVLKSNPLKGLFISGGKGVGKTLNFKILCRVLSAESDIHFVPKCLNVKEIQSNYKLRKDEGAGEHYLQDLVRCKFLVIDDLGMEDTEFNDYGTKRNLIADILMMRYSYGQTNTIYTHATSNLPLKMLEDLYDRRLIDRMKEMFIFEIFKGESLREKSVRVEKQEEKIELTSDEKRKLYLNWYATECRNAEFLQDFRGIMTEQLKDYDAEPDHDEAVKLVEKIRFRETYSLIKTNIDIDTAKNYLRNKKIITENNLTF